MSDDQIKNILDNSKIIKLDGDHLTPASIGLRKAVLGSLNVNDTKTKNINLLIKTISNYLLRT